MTFASDASTTLATCYSLSCKSEESASDLVAIKKRRELNPKPSPSQGKGIRAADTVSNIDLHPYQEIPAQHCRPALSKGARQEKRLSKSKGAKHAGA